MATTLNTTTSITTEITNNSKPSIVPFNIDAQCPIQYVTVYNDRAEVTRLVKHHFDKRGIYDLVLDGFSPSVDLTTLHVTGVTGKECTILEVSYQTLYENAETKTDLTSLDQLQAELDNIQRSIDKHQKEVARLMKQYAWLDGRASKLMNQDEHVDLKDLDSMQQFMDFYHRNLLKLDDARVKEENEIKNLTQRKDGLNAKISGYGVQEQAKRQKVKREVAITVHIASDNVDTSLEVSYLISNCSWSASYDVRVSSVDATRPHTQLTYYGIIVS